jgi:hypothetical protein
VHSRPVFTAFALLDARRPMLPYRPTHAPLKKQSGLAWTRRLIVCDVERAMLGEIGDFPQMHAPAPVGTFSRVPPGCS